MVSNMRELEIKARVDDADALRERLDKLGIQLSDVIVQQDVVYGWPGAEKNPAEHNWLRIRTENETKHLFTIKRSVSGQLDNIEYETEICDPHAMSEAIALMGYKKWSEINKKRQKVRFPTDEIIELCLDEIEGLGTYIELEKMVDESADNAIEEQKLWKILHQLGVYISQQETRGYDVIIKNSKKL